MRRQALVTVVASGLMGMLMVGVSAQEPSAAADAEGAGLLLSCVGSPQDGAIGMHSLTPDIFGDGALNAPHPQALHYDAIQDGELRVVTVEFLVLAED